MKKVMIIAVLIVCGFVANAQNPSATATQTTNLVLSNAIELTFTGTSNATGKNVNLNFLTVNEYANGIESGDQWLKVRSNKDYNISVKTNSANFTYSGNTNPAPVMSVQNVLDLMVRFNYTGATIGAHFSSSHFRKLSDIDRNLLENADRGGNQTFAIKYKATPGFAYPEGTYSVDVVYTATQL